MRRHRSEICFGRTLDQRILFYRERADDNLGRIDQTTTQLQREMWAHRSIRCAGAANAHCDVGRYWNE